MNGSGADELAGELRRDLPAFASYTVVFVALYWTLLLHGGSTALVPMLIALGLYLAQIPRTARRRTDVSTSAALGSYVVQWIVLFPLATLGLNLLGMRVLSEAMGSEWTFYHAIGALANVFVTSALCLVAGVVGLVVLVSAKLVQSDAEDDA